MALTPKKIAALIVALFVVIFGGVGAILFVAIGRGGGDNLVAREALARAQKNDAVIALLGSPVTLGFGGSTYSSREGDQEEGKYEGPLEGPKGRATLRAEGFKLGASWEFMLMMVEQGETRIDLLAPSQPAP